MTALDERKARVHFLGWNARHDQNVPVDGRRLRLPSDANAEGDGVLQAPSMAPPGMHSIHALRTFINEVAAERKKDEEDSVRKSKRLTAPEAGKEGAAPDPAAAAEEEDKVKTTLNSAVCLIPPSKAEHLPALCLALPRGFPSLPRCAVEAFEADLAAAAAPHAPSKPSASSLPQRNKQVPLSPPAAPLNTPATAASASASAGLRTGSGAAQAMGGGKGGGGGKGAVSTARDMSAEFAAAAAGGGLGGSRPPGKDGKDSKGGGGAAKPAAGGGGGAAGAAGASGSAGGPGAGGSKKKGGAGGSPINDLGFPIGSKLEVFLDSGEWEPAEVTHIRRNHQRAHQVTFGPDDFCYLELANNDCVRLVALPAAK